MACRDHQEWMSIYLYLLPILNQAFYLPAAQGKGRYAKNNCILQALILHYLVQFMYGTRTNECEKPLRVLVTIGSVVTYHYQWENSRACNKKRKLAVTSYLESMENLIFADAVKQTCPISINLHAIFLSRHFKAECRYSIYLSRHFKAECRWSIYLSRPIKAGSVLAFIFADALKQTIRNTKKQTKEALGGSYS